MLDQPKAHIESGSGTGACCPDRSGQAAKWTDRLDCLPAASLFAITLAAALANHFLFDHVRNTFIYDGWFYRWTTEQMSNFLSGLTGGHFNPAFVADNALKERLLLDGPVLPLSFGAILSLLHNQVLSHDWRCFVVLQCILHSLSACLVSAIAFRIYRNKLWALLPGLIWGLYPGAIVAAGIFYSETLTVFVILAFVWAVSSPAPNFFTRLAAGMLGGSLVLLKVALAPAVLLSAVYAARSSEKKRANAALTGVGMAIIIACWGAYTHAATGKILLTAQRYPSYNATVGWDTESDGWVTGNNTPLTNLLSDSGPPGTAIVAQWTVRPRECLLLAARKLSRMFAHPWNDFNDNCWGLKPDFLIALHLVLFCLGMFGICSYALDRTDTLGSNARLVSNILLLWIAGHLVYVLFQSIERYAFTSMPFWTIFAGYGLWQMASRPRFGARQAAIVLMAMASSALIVNAATLTRMSGNKETRHLLKPGDTACKTIRFKRVPDSIKTALLIVDGSAGIERAAIEFNGHRVQQNLGPLLYFDPLQYTGANVLANTSHAMGANWHDFRQWRGVPIPVEWLNRNAPNTIKIVQSGLPATIYGDSDPGCRQILSLFTWAPGKMISEDGDGRQMSATLAAAVGQSSALQMAGAGSRPLNESLRVKLALLPGLPEAEGRSGKQASVRIPLPVSKFDKMLWWGWPGQLHINKHTLKAAGSMSARVDLPDLPPSTHIKISLSGEVKAARDKSRAGVVINYLNHWGIPCILARNPDYIPAGKNWQPFNITDLLPVDSIGQRHLDISFFPGPWIDVSNYGCDRNSADISFRDLSVAVSTVNLPVIQSEKLLFY